MFGMDRKCFFIRLYDAGLILSRKVIRYEAYMSDQADSHVVCRTDKDHTH